MCNIGARGELTSCLFDAMVLLLALVLLALAEAFLLHWPHLDKLISST